MTIRANPRGAERHNFATRSIPAVTHFGSPQFGQTPAVAETKVPQREQSTDTPRKSTSEVRALPNSSMRLQV
ncbi:MAG TPA: hypothetical protein VGE67_05290 [Haloferula sp.]